jgi:hypothetical protein
VYKLFFTPAASALSGCGPRASEHHSMQSIIHRSGGGVALREAARETPRRSVGRSSCLLEIWPSVIGSQVCASYIAGAPRVSYLNIITTVAILGISNIQMQGGGLDSARLRSVARRKNAINNIKRRAHTHTHKRRNSFPPVGVVHPIPYKEAPSEKCRRRLRHLCAI